MATGTATRSARHSSAPHDRGLENACAVGGPRHTSGVTRSVLVCTDDFLWRLLADAGASDFDALHLVEQPQARARILQRGGTALAGNLERESLYQRAFRTGHEPVLLSVERARQALSLIHI